MLARSPKHQWLKSLPPFFRTPQYFRSCYGCLLACGCQCCPRVYKAHIGCATGGCCRLSGNVSPVVLLVLVPSLRTEVFKTSGMNHYPTSPCFSTVAKALVAHRSLDEGGFQIPLCRFFVAHALHYFLSSNVLGQPKKTSQKTRIPLDFICICAIILLCCGGNSQ